MLQQLRVAPGTLVLVALLRWAGTYAAELGATDLAAISRWGDVWYVGLVLLLPPGSRSRPCSRGADHG